MANEGGRGGNGCESCYSEWKTDWVGEWRTGSVGSAHGEIILTRIIMMWWGQGKRGRAGKEREKGNESNLEILIEFEVTMGHPDKRSSRERGLAKWVYGSRERLGWGNRFYILIPCGIWGSGGLCQFSSLDPNSLFLPFSDAEVGTLQTTFLLCQLPFLQTLPPEGSCGAEKGELRLPSSLQQLCSARSCQASIQFFLTLAEPASCRLLLRHSSSPALTLSP